MYKNRNIDRDIPSHLKSIATTKGKYYLTNADLLPAVLESIDLNKITDKLARMLMLLADRYSRRSNFVRYTYREDMVSEALVNLCKNALKFNPEKSNNPFAFYTTCLHRSFLLFMASEKKQHYVRDALLLSAGKDPSFNFENNTITKKLKKAEEEKMSKKALKMYKVKAQSATINNILDF